MKTKNQLLQKRTNEYNLKKKNKKNKRERDKFIPIDRQGRQKNGRIHQKVVRYVQEWKNTYFIYIYI